jgi:uncharacterized protein (TIGR02266 family)
MGTPVTVKIKFRSDTVDQFIQQYSADVSEGGIFIRTPQPLSEGTHLTFHFQLQDGSPLLTGSGTVAWVRETGADSGDLSPGMGVRFDSLPPEGTAIVERIMKHKQETEQFEEDLPTRVAPETQRRHQADEQAVAQSSPGLPAASPPAAGAEAPGLASSTPAAETGAPPSADGQPSAAPTFG